MGLDILRAHVEPNLIMHARTSVITTLYLVMALGPADRGHSPFPSPERAFYGFACYLSSYLVAGEALARLAACRVLNVALYDINFRYYNKCLPS